MELCTTSALSNLKPHNRLLINATISRFKISLLRKPSSLSLYNRGVLSYPSTFLGSTSEGTTTRASKYTDERSDGMVAIEDVPPADNDAYMEIGKVEPPKESPTDEQMQLSVDFFDKLNIKLDSADSYSILIYGIGALVAVWFLSAVVGAIDSIPLFPKLMEVVGLAYTLWFSARYLIFKRNRDELAAKIEELKEQVLGWND
ncbi:hypothetical protein Nepgr_027137 [Nepenthes gracilis]|uniref:Cyanobacterial aminoacyl-tRNA synthetase CAAD domain-containing protein n=1 Tax=Nepenthes gracilis TaxID=150966 RepID=A0AAD3TAA6_NEPGR|nr:hypothetical protein Nepgr_027137 [Nepenthes gracilis]